MNINKCLKKMSEINHKLGAIESQQNSLLLEVNKLYGELNRIKFDDPNWDKEYAITEEKLYECYRCHPELVDSGWIDKDDRTLCQDCL